MKIVLIGPVYPYKGGIAHYTSLLYRALSEDNDVTLISYKLQYPRVLFKKEQKDYSSHIFCIEGTKYLINTANPINIWSIGRNIRKAGPDAVIIQWWHPYFSPCYRILCAAIGRKINIFFTCHNIFPHERFPADKALTKMALKHGDGFIVHSLRDAAALKAIKQDAKVKFNLHPTYNTFKIRNIDKTEAVREIIRKDGFDISPNTQTLLFFGFVRAYKGLSYLLHAMPTISTELPNARLMVIGSFSEDRDDYIQLIEDLHLQDKVLLKDDYIPDNEVEKYFAATDLVAVPYVNTTQSGIVQIAFGFEKPCLVTNVGGLPDVISDMKTGYVVEKQDHEAIAQAVIDYFKNDRMKDFQRNIHEESVRFSWKTMAKTIESLLNF